jgi:hypothetical protein
MKIAAFYWLMDLRYDIADFEIGGFDVLGISRRHSSGERASLGSTRSQELDYIRTLSGRMVIDAKTSMGDVYNHFKKDHVPACDLDGKFSRYANLHYLIARKGVVKAEAVHAPWGLLEYNQGLVKITKEAEGRAYIGHEAEVEDIAAKFSQFMRSVFKYPKSWNCVKNIIDPKILLDEIKASTQLVLAHRQLVKACASFQYLYGYNPLKTELSK